MSFIIELENPNDASLIKSQLQRIKGIKNIVEISSVDLSDEVLRDEEIRQKVISISENSTSENCISYDEFKENVRKKICDLKLERKQINH